MKLTRSKDIVIQEQPGAVNAAFGVEERIYIHDNWQFRDITESRWMTARVPGCNFTDLLNNEVIEDPFYGDNEAQLQWIETKDWEYKCSFEIERAFLESPVIELIFEGLDTYCSVYLNGELILEAENMFLQHTIDCKEQLVAGKNELLLYFTSPIKKVRPEFIQNGIVYPAENDKTDEKLSVFTRKAPYQFGWDWGPRFVTSGIFKDVYLQSSGDIQIKDVHLNQHWIAQDHVKLICNLEVNSQINTKALVTFACDAFANNYTREVVLNVGANSLSFAFEVSNPRKWWPNGLGEAFLYDLNIGLSKDNQEIDFRLEKVGFRKIELVTENDEHGESFYVKVNDYPVFMKGANYIPSDSFLANMTNERYEQVIQNALEANMNMLRIWGGGFYEHDYFYELADQHGILIWQDFMFSCSLYPGSEHFVNNIRQELTQVIKRLRNHPSLALWCGNNEVEMGMKLWDWPKKFGYSPTQQEQLHEDYQKIFQELIPSLVAELDGGRYHLISSPNGFSDTEVDYTKGDSHYWGVWHGEEDFQNYKKHIPRFMSEFGFQSFPSFNSIKQYIPTDQYRIDSDSMLQHQKNPGGNDRIARVANNYFREPKDFQSLVYLSQLLQAQGLKVAFESHRAAKPFCMGSLYWQLNDCWPVTSWSGIDYYGKWKALHYQAGKSFAQIVPVVREEGDKFVFQVINDCIEDKLVSLLITCFNTAGDQVSEETIDIDLTSNQNSSIIERRGNLYDNVVYWHMEVVENEEIAGQNYYMNKSARDLTLQAPVFDYEINKEDNRINLKLESQNFVRSLFIDFEGSRGNFSNNFIDLLPGRPVTITYELAKDEAMGELSFMSVYDTYN